MQLLRYRSLDSTNDLINPVRLDPCWVELTRLGYIQTIHEDYVGAEYSYQQAYEIALDQFIKMPETDINAELYNFSRQNLAWVQQQLVKSEY
jgi:hypothetical protein